MRVISEGKVNLLNTMLRQNLFQQAVWIIGISLSEGIKPSKIAKSSLVYNAIQKHFF